MYAWTTYLIILRAHQRMDEKYFVLHAVVSECLHTFCKPCIHQHFVEHLTCPTCEVNLGPVPHEKIRYELCTLPSGRLILLLICELVRSLDRDFVSAYSWCGVLIFNSPALSYTIDRTAPCKILSIRSSRILQKKKRRPRKRCSEVRFRSTVDQIRVKCMKVENQVARTGTNIIILLTRRQPPQQ